MKHYCQLEGIWCAIKNTDIKDGQSMEQPQLIESQNLH